MKLIGLVVAIAAVAVPLFGSNAQDDLDSRMTQLEARVRSLESLHAAPPAAIPDASADGTAIVTVRLARKEAQLEHAGLDYLNLVFDVEFLGTQALGDKRIRDIKGTLYFDDAFGDEIIGATLTKRLGIGAGEQTVIAGLLIDYTTVELSKPWKRVLTTDSEELRLRFVTESVIYEDG